jgi:hypothetical protein
MKKLIIISLLCVFSIVAALSQTSDTLVKVKRSYYLNDKRLNPKELKTVLKSDQESAVVYKKSSTMMITGQAFIGLGTIFILYAAINPPEEDGQMPGTISDEELKKWMVPVYCSLGCIAAAVPFLISGNKQFKKSVTIYNSKQTATGYRNKMIMDIGITPKGVGIFCKF